ncbi:MAG: MFS transporter [Rhizobiales bacterium]|nr:MFS transporter [Hyphomicrobiales bacterium]
MSLEDRTRPWGSPAATAAVMLVGTLIAIYMVTQFLRNSVAVIAPDLARTIGLSAGDLGFLSSSYFFAFALAQLPLGIALDRYGPRRVLLVCAGIMILGCLAFAVATSAAGLVGARILMGLGSSSAFMAALAIYAQRFAPDRFATLTGLQYGLGSIGSLFATAPLAFAAATIGWRGSFVTVAGLTLLAGVLVAVVVKDGAAGRGTAPQETIGEAVAGIRTVLRTLSFGRLFLMHLAAYSSFALFVGLWGGPYLSHIYGYGLTERGELLLIPALAQIVGAFLWGPTDRLFGRYKTPVLLGAGLTVLLLAVLAVAGAPPLPLLIGWMVLFGVLAFTPPLIAHGKSLFPPHLVGRCLTLFNMATMGGVFLTQAVSGVVIDFFPVEDGRYPLVAYRCVFLLQAAFLLIAMAGYLSSREPHRN